MSRTQATAPASSQNVDRTLPTSSSVVAEVLGDGSRLVSSGLALGVLGGAATSRFIAGQLHGVQPTDPISAAVCVVTLATAAALAGLVPALRAARIDSAESLRSDL
jgi:hypothetical protein